MKYKVLAARNEELNEGWVWVNDDPGVWVVDPKARNPVSRPVRTGDHQHWVMKRLSSKDRAKRAIVCISIVPPIKVPTLAMNFTSRSRLCLGNQRNHSETDYNNKKSVYCEQLIIDSNFVEDYNGRKRTRKIDVKEPTICISEWYRLKLDDIETGREYELEKISSEYQLWHIKQWWKIRACLQHPQVVVRLATWLGVIGIFLGIIGVVLGVVPLFKY